MDSEIHQRFEALERRVAALETGREDAAPKPVASKETSIKEFLLAKKPKSERQKTRAVAYYLERFRNYSSFTSIDIEDAYRSAKESIPTNLTDTIGKNVGQGFMMEAKDKKDGKKAWTLTSSGEKDVDQGFTGTE